LVIPLPAAGYNGRDKALIEGDAGGLSHGEHTETPVMIRIRDVADFRRATILLA